MDEPRPSRLIAARSSRMSVLNYVLHTALSDLWARFFCPEDIQRHRRTSFVPENPTTDIMHGDLECRYTFPWFDGKTVPFWNFPWTIANQQTKPAAYKLLFTDLNETEVTEGQKSLKKVEDSFRLAAQEAQSDDIIMLNSACVPDLTGEDPTPFLPKHGEKTKTIYRASDGRDVAYSTTEEMIKKSLDKEKDFSPQSRTVNLVGYPGGKAREELISLLNQVGISVSACVVPSLGFEPLRLARKASLNIMIGHRLFEGEVKDFVAQFPVRSLTPSAPYGVKATRLWLKTVCEAAGIDSQVARDIWEKNWNPLKGRWENLISQSRGKKLAFVLSPKQISQIIDPRWTFAVPMFEMLSEMGFDFNFLIFAKNHPQLKLPKNRFKISLDFFSKEEELTRLLKNGAFDAVYSDYFFDRRISRAGKAQFSLSIFEAGPWGALRTLERFLGICKLPFYGEYGRYLGGKNSWAD